MTQRYPEARRGRRGARWRGGVVGKKKMTGGPQVSVAEREKALRTECVKPRRKRISQNTPRTRGPSGYEASGPVLRWLGGLGRPVGQGRAGEKQAGWAESKERK
jgi:hypothetical protein